MLFRVPHRVSLDRWSTGTNENRHENWERVRVRGGNANERKVFQTMLTMNSWEIMALITKKSKYQETNNLCVNEVSVSYINMLFFLNKLKKSCANQSMLVYIVWLQPCKNYTSSQSIVSVCNKKKISHAFGFLFAQMGLIYIELHIWMNHYCQWKPFLSIQPVLRLGKIKAVFQT